MTFLIECFADIPLSMFNIKSDSHFFFLLSNWLQIFKFFSSTNLYFYEKGPIFCLWRPVEDNYLKIVLLLKFHYWDEATVLHWFVFFSEDYCCWICRKWQSEGERQGERAINNGLCLQLGLMSRGAAFHERSNSRKTRGFLLVGEYQG